MRKETKRGGRGTAHGRASGRAALLVLLAALFVLFPSYAYGQVFNRSDEGGYVSGTVGGYGYTTYGRQQALAEFLGFDWSSFSTTTQSAIMSAGNNDNAFRSALEQTKNVMYETVYSEEDGITAFQWPLVSTFALLFGTDHLWDIKLTRANYEQAQEVVMEYGFAHSSNDEPSQDVFDGFPMTVTLTRGVNTSNSLDVKDYWFNASDGNRYYASDIENITATVNYTGTAALPSGNFDVFVRAEGTNSSNTVSPGYLTAYLCPADTCELKTVNDFTSLVNISDTQIGVYYFSCSSNNTFTYNEPNAIFNGNATTFYTLYVNSNSSVMGENQATRPYYFSGLVQPTNPPYTPTPDPEPEPPEQPIAPTPPTNEPNNTVQEPGNVTVTVKPTFEFDYDVYAGGTADFSGVMDILELIYDRQAQVANDLSSAIDGNVLWLHDELRTFFNNTGRSINQQLVQVSQNIDGYIDDAVYSLENYLHNQLVWLARELKFVYPGETSNADIVHWLKMIYWRLGGQAEEPLTEDGDVWLAIRDWVHEPYEELIDESPEISEDVRAKLERLKSKFPFSIPWDILEIIEMFKADAITPSFSIPVPIPNTDDTYTIAGDFHAFDGVMVHVRTVELIAFTGYMLWNTPQLLNLLDITKGNDNG